MSIWSLLSRRLVYSTDSEEATPLITHVSNFSLVPRLARRFLNFITSAFYTTASVPIAVVAAPVEIPLQVIPKKQKPTKQQLQLFTGAKKDFTSPAQEVKGDNFLSGTDYIEIDTRPNAKERFAQYVLKQAFDADRPLQEEEFVILGLACIVALGAISTSKDFGDNFINGVSKYFSSDSNPDNHSYPREFVEFGVALSNAATQFCLTTKSFINVICRLQRARGLPAHEFVKPLTLLEQRILMGALLTGASSATMIFNSMKKKYQVSSPLAYSLAFLSYTSSAAVNENFTYDKLLSYHGDRYDLAIIRLLTKVKSDLHKLANDSENPHLFIEKLSSGNWFKQLHRRNNFHTELPQLENIIRQLIDLTDPAHPKRFEEPEAWHWLTGEYVLSMLLGLIASFMNIKAGLLVLNFLSLEVLPEINTTEFFENFNHQTNIMYATFITGLLLFGLTAGAVNTIINSRSCRELFAFLKSPTNLSSLSVAERSIFASIIVLSTGYAIGKSGANLKYPLVEVPPIPIIFSCVMLPVFEGLGLLSMRSAWADARNRKDRGLLEKALQADSLSEFYYSLSFTKQQTLRRLLHNSVNLRLNAVYDTYNRVKADVTGEMLFSPELNALLEAKFGANAAVKQTHVQRHVSPLPPVSSAPSPTLSPLEDPMYDFESESDEEDDEKKAEETAEEATAMAQDMSTWRLGFKGTLFTPGPPSPSTGTPLPQLTLSRQNSQSHDSLRDLDSTPPPHSIRSCNSPLLRSYGYGNSH